MKSLTLKEICHATSGALSAANECASISAICTDSRKLKPGCLFVALRGGNFDGHKFVEQAAAAGALAAIVDDKFVGPADLACIRVADTRYALGELAALVRRRFTGKVIAVAGSNGKTGTKHLIHSALQGLPQATAAISPSSSLPLSTKGGDRMAGLRGSMSPKSFNNDIGVPLAIFAADPNDDYVVLELGTNHHGEIARLTEIARPDIVVITNCSAEHLEGLTDLAGVRRENASILSGLAEGGLLFVNGDDADLLAAVKTYGTAQISFGFSPTNDLWATDIECTEGGTHFRLGGGGDFFVPLLGRHAAVNALTAIAVARSLGVKHDAIVAGLANSTAPEMRLQLQRAGGLTILNDAYNANPASMLAALQTIRDIPTAGRRVAVLGEMRELGEWSESSHRDIGQAAAQSQLDALLCVGPDAKWIADAAKAAGLHGNCITCHNSAEEAAEFLSQWIGNGDLLLLKGSRAVGLEKIAAALTNSQAAKLKAAG